MAMERWVEYAEKPCQSSHMLLDGLHAYVTYTVQIQIRLLGSQYWSDETKVQATTPEDKPSQSPELTPGGYVTWDCRQQKCLSLYWKSVPAAAQNGEIIYYQVVVKENETIVTNTTEKTSGNSMTVYIGQRDDVTLVVELSAGTSVGFSSPPSRIDIPPRLETPVPSGPEEVNVERQQNSVNAANATYTVTWSALPGHDQDDYVTVFWCKSKVHPDVPIECLAGMEWTHLPPNITAHTLDLGDEVGRQWYFGVSRTRRNVSRGVTWNRCVYDYMGVPSKPTLQASIKSETEMTVSWDFNMCDIAFLKGLPVTYEIFYRKTDSANPSCLGESARNVTAEVGVKSEVLDNLIYGATYGVCMRILTARNASDVSDVKLATVETLSVESTDRSNVPVFAGVLAAIVAVIMAIGILVFRWKLQLKATMFPSGNLWLPKPKTHGRWDVEIPVEQSLGTGSSPSHTIQVPHDAEIHDQPVTLESTTFRPGCRRYWTRTPPAVSGGAAPEKFCRQPTSVNHRWLLSTGILHQQSAKTTRRVPRHNHHAMTLVQTVQALKTSPQCLLSTAQFNLSPTPRVRQSKSKPSVRSTIAEQKEGQTIKRTRYASHRPPRGERSGAQTRTVLWTSRCCRWRPVCCKCDAGINNTMELQPLTVRSKPSLHGGYISESSLCKSYDVKINNIPRNGYVSHHFPLLHKIFLEMRR
ncbi:uncharacterized protein LOC112574251 [Pomacea canaliculata]|uniref:uncharacterized protein LOC112574251 n=1 Tax=Pomacea canaliculata TaxID=400727 RepID=UPI000D7302BC|nr:uncharacterized protein LOC112574251 [Pomacea canaliculata]